MPFKHEGDFEKICLKVNYQFHSKDLIAQALTTRAAWRNSLQEFSIGHHEELAFFGDSLLRMVIDKILMEEFPYYKVGELSKARDILVRNSNLSEIAKKLELEKFIMMDSNQVKLCEEGNPKLLADTVEAIICAIYKDSNQNLEEVKRFILSYSTIGHSLHKYRQEEDERNYPLILAITEFKIEQVEKLVKEGLSPNFIFTFVENYKHSTPLDVAFRCIEVLSMQKKDVTPMLKIMECLLKNGADVNLVSKTNTPLIRHLITPRTHAGKFVDASWYEFTQSYKKKKKNSSSSRETLKLIEKEVMKSWEKTSDQVLELCLKYGAKFDETEEKQSYTLLQLAIIHNQHYKIDLFIKSKINVNAINNLGKTALHTAVAFGDENLVNKLLEAGADPNIADKWDLKPFDIASTPAIKKLLLTKEIKYSFSPLDMNKKINLDKVNKDACEYYKQGLEKKEPENLGLFSSAARLFELILKFKLSSANTPDKELITHYFNLGSSYFQGKNYEKAKPLLERAYYLYLINENQFEEKKDKFLERFSECKKILKQQKIAKDVEQNNELKKKSSFETEKNLSELDKKLFESIKYFTPKKVEEFLGKGANASAVLEKTGTPVLHYAISIYAETALMAKATEDIPYNEVGIGSFKDRVLDCIDVLLKWGADPNQRDSKGRTALHAAASLDKTHVVSRLLWYRADPNLKDYAGNYASYYAKDNFARFLILEAFQKQAEERINKKLSVVADKEIKKEINIEKQKTQAVEKTPVVLEKQNSKSEVSSNIVTKSSIFNSSSREPVPSQTKNNKIKNKNTRTCKFFKNNDPTTCRKGAQCDFLHVYSK